MIESAIGGGFDHYLEPDDYELSVLVPQAELLPAEWRSCQISCLAVGRVTADSKA
ncbi:hypothetical protein PM082_002162 [Marasmius tenuissimus]|nr:hypothetical protein PM082_002162 [Marasmius tenuissimus]